MRYRAVTVDAAELQLVLSGGETPPAVVSMVRAGAGAAFGELLELTTLTEAPAFEGCDMFGPPDAMYCHRDAGDGDLEIFLVGRL